MGRHRRAAERGGLRRPLTVSLLAAGLVGGIAGVTAVTSQATAHGRKAAVQTPSAVIDSLAGSASPSTTPSPSPSASATPSAAPSVTASPSPSASLSPSPSASPSSPQPSASSGPGLGTTAVAPAGDESNRVGALFTGNVTPGDHFCSASVIDSPTKNLILTAAHCLNTTDGVSFVPGYRDGKSPFGTWQVTKIYTDTNWSQNSDPDVDFAIVVVAPNNGRNIEDVVGGTPLGLNADFSAQVRLYGYPENTEAPIVCTNSTSRQDTYQRRIDCPSYPTGTSGGPWIDTANGKVIGVIGGYQQGGNTDDTSYSSYFDHTVGELYNRAVSSS